MRLEHRQIVVTGLGGNVDERDFPDIDNLQSIDDAVAWLREAGKCCRDTAENTDDPRQSEYLKGRAHAFTLAAQTIEDVTGGRS